MSSLGPKKPRLDLGGDADESSSSAPRLVAVASAGAVELPLLTDGNYHEWALVMQVSLEAMELWDAVEAACKDRAKDRRALSVIIRAVPSGMKAMLAVKKTAEEAWTAVKAMYAGDDRIKASSVQRLWKEFEDIAFRDGESVSNFSMRVQGLVGKLREAGEKLEDGRVVKKILRVVPKKFKQVAVSIEMLMDLNTMKIEELVGRLRVAEDADADEVKEITETAGRLLLTEEQWEARRRQRRGKERAHGDAARHGGSKKGDGRDGGHDEDDDGASMCSGSSRRSERRRSERRNRGRCFNCNERGHIAKFCPRARGGKALLADVEEEPTLL